MSSRIQRKIAGALMMVASTLAAAVFASDLALAETRFGPGAFPGGGGSTSFGPRKGAFPGGGGSSFDFPSGGRAFPGGGGSSFDFPSGGRAFPGGR